MWRGRGEGARRGGDGGFRLTDCHTEKCVHKQSRRWCPGIRELDPRQSYLPTGDFVNFEWDESKRQLNILKHNFDFEDVWQLFSGDT